MNCQEMLQGVFKHVEQNSPGEFPFQGTVFITVTIHTSTDSETHDVVFYAHGPLNPEQEPFKPFQPKVLKGDIQAWVNNTELVELKHPPGNVEVKQVDIFPSGGFKLRVSINDLGFVSVQLLLFGHAYLGRKPVTFNAVCTDGLLTFVTNKTSYTLGFTLRKQSL